MVEFDDDHIPDSVHRTHSLGQYKAAFDGMVRVSDLPHSDEEEPSSFDRRSSYRDMAAFNFLRRHIVANPNTLFFKTDSFAHKERLTRALPYALGMVDANYIMNERRRDEAQREQDRLRKQIAIHDAAKASPLTGDLLTSLARMTKWSLDFLRTNARHQAQLRLETPLTK